MVLRRARPLAQIIHRQSQPRLGRPAARQRSLRLQQHQLPRIRLAHSRNPGCRYGGKEFDRFFKDESDWAHPDYAATNVVDILDDWVAEYSGPGKHFAGQHFEIAGFVWSQGDKDRENMGLATRYEQNLVQLITSLRADNENRYPGKVAANAPFVLATLDQTTLDSNHAGEKAILDAKLAVDGESGKYSQFAGNVKTVYAHPLSEGGASNGHYNQRAGTYLLIGDALGRSMVELLEGTTPGLTFSDWIAGFTAMNGHTAFDDDADGDGIAHGIEASFGTSPNESNPGLQMTAMHGKSVTSTHPHRSQPLENLSGSYQWSLDLSNWHASGAVPGGLQVDLIAGKNQSDTGTTFATATMSGTPPKAVLSVCLPPCNHPDTF